MTPLQMLHNLLPMNIASLSFVYVYLPICLFVYYLAPGKIRAWILLASSITYYVFSSPGYLWLMLISILVDFSLIQAIATTGRPLWKRACFWLCISKNLVLIGYFGIADQTGMLPAPLGLLVYCISGIDAAIEAYNAEGTQPCGFIRFAVYASFFPRLYAGPLVTPREFCERLEKPGFDASGIMTGFGRLATGLLKYATAGRGLFLLYNAIRSIPQDSVSVLSVWSLVLSFMLSIYFTLSGLSDIARGISGMFGLVLPQNFYYPYQSRCVTDFFERFNMTAGNFLNRAVLAPLSNVNKDSAGDCLNLMLTGMLWGALFGMRVNYILWGAVIAVFMIMEKYLYPWFIETMPTLFCRCYTFFIVVFSFAVFSGDTPTGSLRNLKWMSGFGADQIPFLNDRILYLLSSNWLLLLLSSFFATSVASLFVDFLRKAFPRVSGILSAALNTGLLILFTALSLGGGLA